MCNLTSKEHRFLRNGDFKEGERRNVADMSWLIQHPHPFSPTERQDCLKTELLLGPVSKQTKEPCRGKATCHQKPSQEEHSQE